MTFRRGARLDPSQVRDVRGRGLGGSMGGRGMAIGGGGGLIGLVAVVIIYFLSNSGGGTPTSGLDQLINQPIGQPGASSNLAQECRTGQDANERDDCRIVGYVNSIQAYWEETFPEFGNRYTPATTTFFDGSIETACGPASSASGPFYCPNDQDIYLDLGFFNELKTRFGATGGSLSQGYVIAHEYGHHVQNLLGDLGRQDPGAEGGSVRTELQADCYAGVWANNAVETGYLEPISDQQIADALSAAAAVGDDRIQQSAGGAVNPHKWTHGSSEQRQEWFLIGHRGGRPGDCDTFRSDI
ncbi:MAG: neutral zinc metallopeptidase [Chloroflexi bacterium]|nr:neutral zinc metallopeptidase [Chloroflexota bacterium]